MDRVKREAEGVGQREEGEVKEAISDNLGDVRDPGRGLDGVG